MRRTTNPLAALAVVIAVAVVAWWTGGTDSTERLRHRTRDEGRPEARTTPEPARTAPEPARTTPEQARTTPEQAQLQATLALIDRGGPFRYRQDGATFANRERRLPQQPHGYYREYTVPTPGAKNRGARRVVKGRKGEIWYTRDHYRTFIRLD